MNTSDTLLSPRLSVRIVKVDYYLAKPVAEFKDACYSGFRSLPISYLPVIRIFGPSSKGIKTCVHLHGVFPYLFIPNWNDEISEQNLYAFAMNLDKAINTSFACSSSKTAHVHRITEVIGRPFYGYHEQEKKFLKIEFYNPGIIKRAAELLLNGAVFNNSFQPHEAHVPYILQFFIDHNLYGMNFIVFSSYQKRSEGDELHEVCKQTYSELEIDTSIDFICNEMQNEEDKPNNPGLAFIWEEEKKRRRLQGKESQLNSTTSQVRADRVPTRTESLHKWKLSEKISRFKSSVNFGEINSHPNREFFDEDDDIFSEAELNTQGRELLEMLENLQNENKELREKASSPSSSPSVVYSDEDEGQDENKFAHNIAKLCSQPILKVTGENDSILGNNFSDEDVDEQDHLILSYSNFQSHDNAFNTDLEHDDIDRISQLDGVDDEQFSTSKRKTKRVQKQLASERRSKFSWNLRSRQSSVNNPSLNENSSISPRKPYPQLQIDTKTSPKISRIAATSQSTSDTFSTSFPSENLSSPSRQIYLSEPRKSDSKRPYPQLEVNIEKSPRTGITDSDDKINPKTRTLKRRRIDFDKDANPGMILMTTRWKKRRKKEVSHSVTNNLTDVLEKQSIEKISDSVSHKEIFSDNINQKYDSEILADSNGMYNYTNEIGSQKYSLKIRLDSCGSTDELKMIRNLMTKTPAVIVDKMPNVNGEIVDSKSTKTLSCGSIGKKVTTESERHSSFHKNQLQTEKDSKPLSLNSHSLSRGSPDTDTVMLNKDNQNSECSSTGSCPYNDTSPNRGHIDSSFATVYKYSEIDDTEYLFQGMDENIVQNPRYKVTTEHLPKLCVPQSPVRIESKVFSVEDDFEHESPIVENKKVPLPLHSSAELEAFTPEINENTETEFKGSSQPELGPGQLFKEDLIQTQVRNEDKIVKFAKHLDCDSTSGEVLFSQYGVNDDAFMNLSFSQMVLKCEKRNSQTKNDNEIENSAKSKKEKQFTSDTPKFLDNSIWDSNGSYEDDDNKIRSFHPEDETIFREAIENETSSEDLASEESGIRSFNFDISDNEQIVEDDNKLSPSLLRKSSDEVSSEGSPIGSQDIILHSTPRHITNKKSPSPTCTPILKKLMKRRIRGKKERTSSQRFSQKFKSQSYLAKIEEEDEAKKKDQENGNSLSTNVTDINKDESNDKSFNNSHSSCNVGSGQIDITMADINKDKSNDKSFNNSHSSCNVGSGQIDLTMANSYGFRMSFENLQNVKANIQHQYITVMSVEIFAVTRGNLYPDPEFDSVHALFYSISQDDPSSTNLKTGMIMVENNTTPLDMSRFNCDKLFVTEEKQLFNEFVSLMRKWDPDILVGYEIEMLSWGYLIQRGHFLGRQYDHELSRIKEIKNPTFKDRTVIEDSEYSDTLKLTGRIMLNVWRLMRHEIALQSYTFENIFFNVMHQRVPKHSFRVLTEWWKTFLRRWAVIDYFLLRVESNILLLQQLDFIGRTSELARLFGIQFFEVLSRGSQFRVESMMLRLAKTRNFVAVSPSVKQRASMRAPESLPLIMEPESKFYNDPVIVLDFQSLYPSIIIAYNYCFSTCLGRVEYLLNKETFKLGCVQHTVPANLVMKLEPFLNFSPCGVAFVNGNIRLGILPLMLQEILNTRLMVKKAMKDNKDNKTLQRVLHARQLGLKLIANVTYGYTSANFSGRMPCMEVGDSVVSKGRETLERAIEMVTNNKKWDAKVIYGDTDSIFIMVPNRTKEEAFRIGNEIADVVTNENPKPVKLKFEKVYYPCILQTKKRYVGYMYESVDQVEPIYDAKGIETVRRDGCPAVSKILEKSLKLLFDNKDINTIKQYVQRQFSKLIAGRLSIQELTFAREYRGMNNYKPAACVPALQIARQAILRDRRSEPRVKERVRYVLMVGPPGVPLIKSVKTPEEFLNTPGSIINAEYYITRAIIPALERCFSLMDVDVRAWYFELPRKFKYHLPVENDIQNKACKKKIISHYFATSKCISCDEISIDGVCKKCQNNPQKLSLNLGTMINKLQRKFNYISKICRSCSSNGLIKCSSLDCPVFYSYHQAIRDVEQVSYLEKLQQTFLHQALTCNF